MNIDQAEQLLKHLREYCKISGNKVLINVNYCFINNSLVVNTNEIVQGEEFTQDVRRPAAIANGNIQDNQSIIPNETLAERPKLYIRPDGVTYYPGIKIEVLQGKKNSQIMSSVEPSKIFYRKNNEYFALNKITNFRVTYSSEISVGQKISVKITHPECQNDPTRYLYFENGKNTIDFDLVYINDIKLYCKKKSQYSRSHALNNMISPHLLEIRIDSIVFTAFIVAVGHCYHNIK